jgi:hypothetical protein
LIEKIELVQEPVVTDCIAVSRAEIVGKFSTGTKSVIEKKRRDS